MKAYLWLIVLGTVLMNSCTYTGYDESEPGFKTKPGQQAYQYTEQSLVRFTDIIAYSRMFREYVKQQTVDGRDSVYALYFANASIIKGKDIKSGKASYTLKPRYEQEEHQYKITFVNPDADIWTVKAQTVSSDDTLYYALVIKDVYSQTWNITESECVPRPTAINSDNNANKDEESEYNRVPYRNEFIVRNNPITVKWTTKSLYPMFEIQGDGLLESCVSPKLKIDYRFESPLLVQSFPNFESIDRSNEAFRYVSHFTAWLSGNIHMSVKDSLDNSTDLYKVTLSEQYMSIKFDNVSEEWTR